MSDGGQAGAERGGAGEFVVAPRAGAEQAGGTSPAPGQRAYLARRHVANPDDPPVPAPLRPEQGRRPADDAGTEGRMAIVQGQVYIAGVILVAQLWLITTALYDVLSGRAGSAWGLAIASGIGFVVALVVALWPGRRVRGM